MRMKVAIAGLVMLTAGCTSTSLDNRIECHAFMKHQVGATTNGFGKYKAKNGLRGIGQLFKTCRSKGLKAAAERWKGIQELKEKGQWTPDS